MSLTHVPATSQIVLRDDVETSIEEAFDFDTGYLKSQQTEKTNPQARFLRRWRNAQLLVHIDKDAGLPLFRAVSEAIRQSIFDGRLMPGQPLPSTRELADMLHLSRSTALRCYEDLVSQGLIETTVGSGTYVSRRLPSAALAKAAEKFQTMTEQIEDAHEAVDWSSFARRLANAECGIDQQVCQVAELNFGFPVEQLMPVPQWERMLLRHSHLDVFARLTYDSDAFGLLSLREALCSYLNRSRSVKASAQQVCMFSGTQSALDLICRLVLDPGDTVAMENPGYTGARRTFLSHSAKVINIPVDDDGIVVEELYNREEPIKLVYVTPSHQDPTGAVLSLDRRRRLLEWAKCRGALVVEDDYDSEYRYGAAHLPSIQSMDTADLVVYMSSFWKTMGTATRMGYAVMPRRMVKMWQCAKSILQRDFPVTEQLAMADFIKEGYLERHIHRSRGILARRRQALLHALTLSFGKLVHLSRETSAFHQLVRFPVNIREDFIITAASETGVRLISTRRYYAENPVRGEYLIAFAHEDDVPLRQAVEKFAERVKPAVEARNPVPIPSQ